MKHPYEIGALVFTVALIAGLLTGVAAKNIEIYYEILPTADARSDDEPKCYTSACEKKHGSGAVGEDDTTSEYEQIQEQKETAMDAVNEEMKRVKKEIANSKTEIDKLQDALPDLRLQLLEQEEVERMAGNAHKGMKMELKQYKKEYRVAYESATTTEQMDAAKQLKVEYQNYELQYNQSIADHNKESAETAKLKERIEEKEDQLDELRETLIELEDEFEELKVDMYKAGRNDQFVSIRLSNTCEMLIASGNPTVCPKYEELVPMFDNTDARISGGFVWDDENNDLNRERPKMQNYELYYEQVPNWMVISVDPDARMMVKGSLVEIAPNRVHFICTPNSSICKIPEDWDKNERYVQYDIHINKYCDHALVSPTMDAITSAVNQLREGCDSGEDMWKKLITLPIFGDVMIYNHSWINNFLSGVGN